MNPGRNDPCPCGSGKKYKKCCGAAGAASSYTAPIAVGAALGRANALLQRGRLREATALYEEVLRSNPDNAEALHRLALVAQQSNQLDAALTLIQRAIAQQPQTADYHVALGNMLLGAGRPEDARDVYLRALALRHDDGGCLFNLGLACQRLGRLEEAASHYRMAAKFRPGDFRAHNNLGNILKRQGRFEESVAEYEQVLRLEPGFADAYYNMALAYEGLNRLADAAVSYQRALALSPDDAEALTNLGNILQWQGRVGEAIDHYRRALAARPGYAAAHSNLLMVQNYLPDLAPQALFEEHLAFGRAQEADLVPKFHDNLPEPQRRLRLGYLSADFRVHSVAAFIEPVLAAHDRGRFEIFAYYNHEVQDGVTERIRGRCDHWRSVAASTDDALAERVRADRIDILVDLSGHTAENRLPVFARKPAPLQLTWLGYPNTTGLSAMDARITDALADPPGETEHLHTETLVRLPECFSCFQPPEDSPDPVASPADGRGCVTFGSFNNFPKINSGVIDLWARLLGAVPGSRLLVKCGALEDEEVKAGLADAFGRRGIEAGRLDLRGRDADPMVHLGRYNEVDIALDTFPYNGTATTCEALWMGVPVVTLAGATHAARVGVSFLTQLGLQELIAGTPEDYLDIAAGLASDSERLRELRVGLRARMSRSPLTDGPRFTRHLEAACLDLWRQWCERQTSAIAD